MYESRCKVCNSPLREQIEEKYQRGMSARAISIWLKEQGIKISDHAITNHMVKHFNIREEVRKEYIKRKSDNEDGMKEYVKEELDEIEELNNIIRESKALRKMAFEGIKEAMKPRYIEVWTTTWSNAAREAVRAMKIKAEKLGTTVKDELTDLLKELWKDELEE